MKTYNVTIKGTTPLMWCKFPVDAEVQPHTRKTKIDKGTPREQAEKVCYRDKENRCYFPSAAIIAMMKEAGANYKQRSSRKSVKWIIPVAVRVPEENILIRDDKGSAATDFEIDSRPVTIPATQGTIMCHRPRWDTWTASFSLGIRDDVLAPEDIYKYLSEGGNFVGLGAFRPTCGGPYGTFQVTNWEELGAPRK